MRSLTSSRAQLLDDPLWATDTWSPSAPAPRHDLPQSSTPAWMLAEDERPRCAVSECNAQPKFWKKSGRPIFDGRWACSKACALQLIQSAVRKQLANESPDLEATPHRHRIPLGLVLLDQGLITNFQLRQALDAQRTAGHGRIGEWLDQTCNIGSDKIVRALATQWNRPVLSSLGCNPAQMALVMPMSLRHAMRILPLRVAGGKILYAAFEDQVDVAGVAALERMTGLTVESGLLPHDEFVTTERRLTRAAQVARREQIITGDQDLSEKIVNLLFAEQPVASRLVHTHGAWWLRLWLERAAAGPHGTIPATGEDVLDILFRS